MDIINLMFVIGLSILITRSKPIILLKRYVGIKDEEFDDYNKPKQLFIELISCCWCLSFWIGFILYGFKIGVISSGISFLIDENY